MGTAGLGDRVEEELPRSGGTLWGQLGTSTLGCGHSAAGLAAGLGDTGTVRGVGRGDSPVIPVLAAGVTAGTAAGVGVKHRPPGPGAPLCQPHGLCGTRGLSGGAVAGGPRPGLRLAQGHGGQGQQGGGGSRSGRPKPVLTEWEGPREGASEVGQGGSSSSPSAAAASSDRGMNDGHFVTHGCHQVFHVRPPFCSICIPLSVSQPVPVTPTPVSSQRG